MCKWTVCVFVIGLVLQVSTKNSTIVIHELSGTDSAQLGSNTTTIICDYDYGNDTGVEIKWFYNDTVPIFLWVPTFNEPKPMGPFSDLLEVTNNTIHFKEMKRNLTGNYTCKVSSNEGEKSRTEPLIAYQPAMEVSFSIEDDSESLICAAYELYPLPTITLTGNYMSESNDTIILELVDDEISKTQNDFLNITRIWRYDKNNLTGSAEFMCNVFIPDTSYNETKIVSYLIAGNESTTEYPDITTETSINSTTIASTTSTHKGDMAMVSSAPSKWLMIVLAILVAVSKL